MSRTKQGGSVLGFTIMGVGMVLLLLAGVYAVRHYWAPASEVAQVNGPSATQSGDNSTTSNQKQGSDSGKSTDNQPQTTPPVQPPATAPATPTPAAPSPAKLPTTGPADSLLSAMILGLMAAAGAAYVQSLRHRATL